jgi:hypothetical protein
MVPKKKKGKPSEELTTDEVMKKLFPLKELQRIIHIEDPKNKKKPSR